MGGVYTNFSILNQKGTPAMFSDALANRPPFGFAGRLFIDTDIPSTGIYRDTGTAWEKISSLGTLQDLQSVLTVGNLTTQNAIFNSIVTVGQGTLNNAVQFFVNQSTAFTGSNSAGSAVERAATYPPGTLTAGLSFAAQYVSNTITLQGNVTAPATLSSIGSFYARNIYTLAGNTLTVSQGSGNRSAAGLKSQIIFTAGTGTISHLANYWGSSFFESVNGSFTGTITNGYGLVLSSLTEQLTASVMPNRWGIWQEGVNDANYFAGKVHIGTSTLTADIFRVIGQTSILSGASNTVINGNSGGTVFLGNWGLNNVRLINNIFNYSRSGSYISSTAVFTIETDSNATDCMLISKQNSNGTHGQIFLAKGSSIEATIGWSVVNSGDFRLTAGGGAIFYANAGEFAFGDTNVNASAIVAFNSTTQGVLMPRMTTAQINAIASPADGLLVYNTTINHICARQGGAWVRFTNTPM